MKINDILMESGFSPLTLKVDNPKGNWLEDKRKYSEKNGRRPSGRLNILGSTTGWFNREAFIPVSLLKNIKGTNDEQKKVRQSDLDWLVNFMGEHGKLPDADWHEFNEYAPMIVIGQDGIPFVNEGNHRIMAADKLGFVALPVEIKYYNGGELEDGILSPDKVSEYDTKMRDAGVFYGRYKPENKAVNESGVDVKGLEDSLIEKYDLKSLMLHLDSNGRLEIGMIAVGKENMGQGTGSLVMQEITDFADTHGLVVTLTTGVKDPNFGTTSQSRLIKFYKRFGFVQNKGKNKDFTISRSMYRLPQ